MRVLVVEDDPIQQELLRRWLTGWKYFVIVTDSSSAALESMLAEPSDIMLCDIVMPGKHDGIWLIERVRARWPHTAVIVASGKMDIDTVMRSQKLGAVDFVTKPFGKEMLRWIALKRSGELNVQLAV